MKEEKDYFRIEDENGTSTSCIGENGARVGRLNVKNDSLTTPICLTGTRGGGSIPHLTKETLEIQDPYWTTTKNPLLLPYNYHMENIDVYQLFNKDVASFIGMSDNPTFVCPMDPSEPAKPGYHTNADISLWSATNNKKKVNVKDYLEGIKALKPDFFVSLCDGETVSDSTIKRVIKSSDKTLRFLKETLNELSMLQSDEYGKLFVPLEGGYDRHSRINHAKQVLDIPDSKSLIFGYFYDGFHLNGQLDKNFQIEPVIDIIKEIITILPIDKPRMISGSFNPSMIMALVEVGMDIFESSYPFHCTSKGLALSFQNTIQKRLSNPENHGDTLETSINPIPSDSYFLNLNDIKYKEDFGPILSHCDCYSCRKHTRGYINHLLATKELLGQVLLMLHNIHHYRIFFESIRNSIRENKFNEFKSIIDNHGIN